MACITNTESPSRRCCCWPSSRPLRTNSELAESVQDLLGRLAERDRELMTANADLALYRGELDRAHQLFRDLEKEYPDDLNALLGPLQVLFLRQDYSGILDAIMENSRRSTPSRSGVAMPCKAWATTVPASKASRKA